MLRNTKYLWSYSLPYLLRNKLQGGGSSYRSYVHLVHQYGKFTSARVAYGEVLTCPCPMMDGYLLMNARAAGLLVTSNLFFPFSFGHGRFSLWQST